MNKKIATFFICSFIALVNSTPIDSADNANQSTVTNGQYEVTPMPADGSIAVKTIPPGRLSNNAESGDLPPSTVGGAKSPQAVSFVSPPVTAPIHVTQNASNASVVTPPITILPTTTPAVPTTPSVPTIPSVTNTTTTNTTTSTATTTVTVPTTTVTVPTTTTTGTTNPPMTTTPGTTPGTTTATVSTTPAPAPTAAPSKDRRFDGPSFIGGIVLSLGIMAIGFVAWKFYKARTERNYHTL